MPTYIQNYGFTKTYIKDNNKKVKNELQWIGDYDGNKANVKLDINDNGIKKVVSMQLDNNDLMNILGIQPIQKPLEQRLTNDFLDESYTPITLEGVLTKRKTRKHLSRKHSSRKNKYKHHHKRRKTYKV
jgi:hypothetical protein